MAKERFDTEPLTTRPAGSEWKAFERAARSGELGAELAVRGVERFRYGFLFIAFIIGIPSIPIAVLLVEGTTLLTVSISAVWVAALLLTAVISLWIRRLDLWGPKTRQGFQLSQFARANGLVHEPSPEVVRPAADLFDSASPRREHLDLLRSPGVGGFRVANYREARDWDGAESYWLEAGYVMIPLRRSYPHVFASTSAQRGPRELRAEAPALSAYASAEAVDGPGGLHIRCAKPGHPPLVQLLDESRVLERASAVGVTEIEIIGDQLFLVRRGGFLPLASPKFWESIEEVLDALGLFGATAAQP